MKPRFVVRLLGPAILLSVGIVVAACGDDAGTPQSGGADGDSAGGGTTRQFDLALSALERKCSDDREMIANMASSAQKLLQEKGINLRLVEVMREVNESIAPGSGEQPCADIFASYVAQQ